MGSKDFRHRESKKPKKSAKKLVQPTTILPPPVEVEVVKKGKKHKEAEFEEE